MDEPAGAKPRAGEAAGSDASGPGPRAPEPAAASGGARAERRFEGIPEDWEGDPQAHFIKGDLARVGALQVLSDFDRIGFRFGMQRIDRRWYTMFVPEVDLKFYDKAVQIGLSAPLRFLFLDEGAPVDEAYVGFNTRVRQEDWDEPGDFLKILHYLMIGGKEREFYLTIGRNNPVTLGHGTLVRRYTSNLDVDHTRTTAELDLYNDYAGMEAFVGDVTSPTVVGALFFVKPGAFIGPGRPLKRLSIGVSTVADVAAPERLETVEGPSGQELVSVDSTGNPVFRDTRLTAVGVDAEIKVVRTAHADVKPYVDHSMFLGHGSGTSLGVLARFTMGEDLVSAMRLRLEARTFDSDFMPGYFDTLYEFQRFQYVTEANADDQTMAPTKLAWLEAQADGPRRYGYYLEATYALVGYFAVSAALEDSTEDYGKTMVLHAEIPASKYFTFFLTYMHNRTGSFSIPFEFDEDNEVFFWAWRVKLLPILALNYRSQRAFEVNRRARTSVDRLFDNVFHFSVDLELGYEF